MKISQLLSAMGLSVSRLFEDVFLILLLANSKRVDIRLEIYDYHDILVTSYVYNVFFIFLFKLKKYY